MNCMALVMRDILICHQTCIVMFRAIRALCLWSFQNWNELNFGALSNDTSLAPLTSLLGSGPATWRMRWLYQQSVFDFVLHDNMMSDIIMSWSYMIIMILLNYFATYCLTFLGPEECKKRFQVELEFVQCLSNPHYLNCK